MRKLTNLESIVQLHDGLAGLYFYSEFVGFFMQTIFGDRSNSFNKKHSYAPLKTSTP